MTALFWNASERRLRALWRLCLHALLTMALAGVPVIAVAEPLTALYRRGLFLPALSHAAYDRVINMIVGPLLTLAIIGSVAIAGRWLDHRRFEEFGTRLDRRWWTGLGEGLVVGAVLMALIFLAEYAAGWAAPAGFAVRNVPEVSFALSLAFSTVKVLCAGTYEEFVSRGYHLRNIADGVNLPVGVIVSSAAFALLHLTNANTSFLSTAGLFVNALLFATARVATGRLSAAIGIHIAWNLFEGSVFGFPVSGDLEGGSLIGVRQLGPGLVTGGAYGPEGGLIGMAASLIGIGWLWLAHGRQRTRRRTRPRA